MQTDHAVVEGRFDGTYNTHGGTQFLASNFNTNGAPIYFDSSPGTYRLGRAVYIRKTIDEI